MLFFSLCLSFLDVKWNNLFSRELDLLLQRNRTMKLAKEDRKEEIDWFGWINLPIQQFNLIKTNYLKITRKLLENYSIITRTLKKQPVWDHKHRGSWESMKLNLKMVPWHFLEPDLGTDSLQDTWTFEKDYQVVKAKKTWN